MGYGPWIEEVFANLISNAVKYIGKDNEAPCITIRGMRDGDMVRYEVEDNGLGIKPEDQARLFDMFSRFHKGEEAGFGLGMSIIQRIVTKLKGTMGVQSEPGVGSTFWFALPAPPDEGD
jgi:signal transduction histidine kinase